MFKKILLATDGSALSEKAAQAAFSFAATQGASVVGLAVAPLLGSTLAGRHRHLIR